MLENAVAVLIPTYNRIEIVIETLYCLKWNLRANIPIHIYVGVDGGDGTYEALANLSKRSPSDLLIHVYRGPRLLGTSSGLGANLNRLIEHASTHRYLMQMDDDHQLTGELDLTPHIAKLSEWKLPNQNGLDVGWIRLMGVAHHKLKADLVGQYWCVDWTSSELYITSNRPHIKRADWHTTYGLYPEGLSLADTEDKFCWACKERALRDGGPVVAVPLNLNESLWRHVGQSWQSRGE